MIHAIEKDERKKYTNTTPLWAYKWISGKIDNYQIFYTDNEKLQSLSNKIKEDRLNKLLESFKIKDLSFLDKIIKESKYICDLHDNWDEEWAVAINKELWNLSIDILKNIYNSLDINSIKILPLPSILPTINWWIDISWINNNFSILISIFDKNEVYFDIFIWRDKDITSWKFKIDKFIALVKALHE